MSDSASDVGEKRRYDVFVSYNRAETPTVERIARRLRAEDLEVFFDRWAVTAGRSWQEETLEAMQGAAACGVFIGREGLGDWAREELAVAQSRAAKDPRFRLFMVLLAGAPSPLDPRLAFLSTRSWVDLRPNGGDGSAFEGLVAAITGVPRHPQPRSIDNTSCPYRGLEPFDERHAGLFFGREDDTRRLCERLSGSRFVAVLGPSGSGKSSVVKAGLIPALRADALPHSAEWTIRTVTPGGSPLAALAAQLAHVAAGDSMHRTLDALAEDERTLDLAVALALADRPTGHRFVLVVDQLEEVFTLCRDEAERAAFLANLIYAATIPGGRTIVVVTLRADFYYRCALYPALRSVLALQQMLIGPLEDEGLRRAIEGPAWAASLTLEPGLVDTILADVGDRPGTLPLLQHVLMQVWQRRRGRLLTLEAYVESGGVRGALAKHADAVYDQLSEAERDLTERVLLRLVQPVEGTEDARRRVDVDELFTAGDEPTEVEAVMRTLADERLLTTSRDETSGSRLVEITHEALLQGWPRLRRWIERDREALLAHRRLTEASREWQRSGRDDALLYRGTRLAAWRPRSEHGARSRRARLTETVEWRARRDRSLNQLEREFLDASDAREQRERASRRRRMGLAFAGLTTALAAITVVAVVAVYQGREAERQRDIAVSRDIAASAADVLTADPSLSVSLALRALGAANTDQAATALRQATHEMRALAVFHAHKNWAYSAAFSPDALRAVSAGADGRVRLWDLRARRPLRVLRGGGSQVFEATFSPDGKEVAMADEDGTVSVTAVERPAWRPVLKVRGEGASSVAFSPDGRRVVAAITDGTVRVASTTARGPQQVLRGHHGFVFGAEFSPNGRRVLSWGVDGTVRVWDLASGRAVKVLRGHHDTVPSAAFSPDGRRIVSAGYDARIRVWNAQSGAELRRFRAQYGPYVARFSPDGRRILTAGRDGAVRILDADDQRAPALVVLRGHKAPVVDARFSADGHQVITASQDGTVRVWNPSTPVLLPASGNDATFTPDGRRIVAGDEDGDVRVLSPTGAPGDVRLRGGGEPVSVVAVAPHGQLVASGDEKGAVRIWRLQQPRTPAVVLRGHHVRISGLAFSSDGRHLVTAGYDGRVNLWSPPSVRPVVVARYRNSLYSVALARDDRRVVVAGEDGVLAIRSIASGGPALVLRGHHGAVVSAAFSADGHLVASGGADGTVRLWASSGRALKVLRGHAGPVESVAFRRDGRQIVSAGADRTVRVWDPAQREALVVIHGGAPISADFDREGRRIVSANANGRVRVSPCDVCGPLAEVLALAHARAARQLTREERERFLPADG